MESENHQVKTVKSFARGPPDKYRVHVLRKAEKMARRIRNKSRAEAGHFGSVLKDFREAKSKSQADLARALQVDQAHIARTERGLRGPLTQRAIERAIKFLELKPLEAQKLRLSSIKTQYSLGDYLIPLNRGDIPQEVYLNWSEIWVVGNAPIEFSNDAENPVYDAVYDLLRQGLTRFVYWVPKSSAHDFEAFLKRIENDLDRDKIPRDRAARYLEAIVSPQHLCKEQYAFYNPLVEKSREGRMAVGATESKSNEMSYVIPMAHDHIEKIVRLLQPVYDALRNKSMKKHPEGFVYRRLFP